MTITESYTNTDDTDTGDIQDSQYYSQTFKAGFSGSRHNFIPSWVSIICMNAGGWGGASANLAIVKIMAIDSDFEPIPNIVYASSAKICKDLPIYGSPDWVWFPFKNNDNIASPLSKDTKYGLVLSGTGSFALGRSWMARYDIDGTYSGQLLTRDPFTTVWNAIPGSLIFKISGLITPYEYGRLENDPTNATYEGRLIYEANIICSSAANTFSDTASIRYCDIPITGGRITKDQIVFEISANIDSYNNNLFPATIKSDTYDKYNPKLMVGIYDSNSPNSYDYNPMFGLEFCLFPKYKHLHGDVRNGTYGVHGSGNYIATSCWYGNQNLYLYKLINGKLNLEDVISAPGYQRNLNVGKYIHLCRMTNGIAAYSFTGSELIYLNEWDDNYNSLEDVWTSGQYVFLADGYAGEKVLRFDGLTYTSIYEKRTGAGPTYYWDVWSDGKYFYFASDKSGLSAYTFSTGTSTLHYLDHEECGACYDVYGDGKYIYVTCTSGLRAYTFNGQSLTLSGSLVSGNSWRYYGISADDKYIYTTFGNKGTYIYSFDGANFNLIDKNNDYETAYHIYSHNYNVYTASYGQYETSELHYGYMPKYSVRPFLSKDITSSNPTNPEYQCGLWTMTGSASYKCELLGTNFNFYVDRVLNQTWDISNITLDGNYKFGLGNTYDWDTFRFQVIDATGDSIYMGSSNLPSISGSISWLKTYAIPDQYLATSIDSGVNWTIDNTNQLVYEIGWNQDYVWGESNSQTSIDNFGLHYYSVSEPLLTTYTDVLNYANNIRDTYLSGITKGSLIINGRTDITLDSKFALYGSNLNIDDEFIISEFTHSIDNRGFTTNIAYGEAPYNIAIKLANVEKELFL
jgi:hypothetical protein